MIRPAKYLRKQSSLREQIVRSPKKTSAESDAGAASSVRRLQLKPTQLEATRGNAFPQSFLTGRQRRQNRPLPTLMLMLIAADCISHIDSSLVLPAVPGEPRPRLEAAARVFPKPAWVSEDGQDFSRHVPTTTDSPGARYARGSFIGPLRGRWRFGSFASQRLRSQGRSISPFLCRPAKEREDGSSAFLWILSSFCFHSFSFFSSD